jgi:hypothetical protein
MFIGLTSPSIMLDKLFWPTCKGSNDIPTVPHGAFVVGHVVEVSKPFVAVIHHILSHIIKLARFVICRDRTRDQLQGHIIPKNEPCYVLSY